MIRTLNAGESQATLEGLRREFPFLADAITGYAIGDVWARPVLDHRAHQIAAVSAFAALGNSTFMKIHAGYALNLGVSEDDLKEVVYLTTVHYAAGSDAVEVILGKITTMRNEIERWRELSVSTDLVVEKHCNREV
jgi:alkylhydroperoxidase/carboxymuconolactone decarboxylase family protein YurZ